MDLITVDMETFYDREYSLSKLTTEAYIRDPRFEVIGVSVKVNDNETDWYSGDRPDRFLNSIDWSNKAALAHNMAFDGAILSWRFGIKPAFLFDTMSMARPFHANGCGVSLKALAQEYGLQAKGDAVLHALGKRRKDFSPGEMQAYADYCIGDTEITYQLFQILKQKTSPLELHTINTTLRMYTEPMLILDKPRLEAHLVAERERKEKLLAKLGGEQARKLIMSNPKFAELLMALGVDPPTKLSPTTGKITFAFAKNDQDFLALQMHENPRVQTVVAARLGTKSTLEETRTEKFLEMSDRGPLPVPLMYYGAHTGRFSGCLTADTMVTVFDPMQGVVQKRIVDVLTDDLVWDGEAFVAHEGVKFSGFQEVISWDGVTGTEDHVVFTDAGEITLREAMQGGHRIQTAELPAGYAAHPSGAVEQVY